jgi:hypothetical protein
MRGFNYKNSHMYTIYCEEVHNLHYIPLLPFFLSRFSVFNQFYYAILYIYVCLCTYT